MSGLAIGICTHGGPGIGLGHVRRCLALAEALRKGQARVTFIVNDDAQVQSLIERHDFEAAVVSEVDDLPMATLQVLASWPAAVLITDSYKIGTNDLATLHPHVGTLVAFDDLADRSLPVDIVINAAIGAETLPYADLTDARLLLGPKYCPLRDEFARDPDRLIRPNVERVLITVGGSDRHSLTSRLIQWARPILPDAQVDVVVGPFFDGQSMVADANVTFHCDPPNMRELMLACDLAVCGGGQTTYELAATGTPALAVQIAGNQIQNLKGLSDAGTLMLAGGINAVDLENRVKAGLRSLAGNVPQRVAMSARGRELIDGRGAERAAQAIMHFSQSRM
jgi:UDP-2,4-diacetamido-2,4,6-trideoxy-beta-L-altropyranose hydrolase